MHAQKFRFPFDFVHIKDKEMQGIFREGVRHAGIQNRSRIRYAAAFHE